LGRKVTECRTGTLKLPGAPTAAAGTKNQSFQNISELSAARLVRIYGGRAGDVVALASQGLRLMDVFDEETGAIAAEVVFTFKHEVARTLTDVMLRRTMVGLNSTCGLKSIEAAAEICRANLGWDTRRVDKEIESYRDYVKRFRPKVAR
jgi:glycerol-3-phosphate dehydrogenase